MFNFFNRNKEIVLKAPFEGKIVDIEEVSDPVFSSKMLGEGVAIKPTSNTAVAPCDGEITQIFPTNHAFGITTKEGLEILVHIGIDTVNLKGEGFKRLVEVGTNVKKGTAIIEVDLEYIKQSGKESITPVVITNMDQVERIDKNLNDREEILKIKIKK
ncbi:MAG: PTS glucose transporter subunit IIA [Anaeromicrobium sp.]|jgi:glucose-specific phosphotransferase system IIA component|uniref:PTS sugar transporter subunit IIA n=1 Tax=Anaeromicrobium sp. TaxID=1929132 RepID=UPI0025D448AF|nr:PTS glucose transporter subunit IIA [Anaeromicrobium sp.]MCT4593040.1 PTS glucose transporter subunit IIA [Anaeromicrobium sp.]